MIKILTEEYFEECLQMLLSQEKIAGYPVIDSRFYEQVLRRCFTKEKHEVLGYFEDNKLVSWMAIGFFYHTTVGDFWFMTIFITSKKRNYFRFSNVDIKSLFKKAYEIAESKGYTQYFYMISERVERVYEKQWYKDNPKRYELITIAKIPPFTRPAKNLYWKMMNQQVKPHTTYIKMRKLIDPQSNK